MKALAEFLLSFESFRAELTRLGWQAPAPGPKNGGPVPPKPPK